MHIGALGASGRAEGGSGATHPCPASPSPHASLPTLSQPHRPQNFPRRPGTLLSLALMQTWLWLYSRLKVCVSRRRHCGRTGRAVGQEAPSSTPPHLPHRVTTTPWDSSPSVGRYLHSQLLLPLAGGLGQRGPSLRGPVCGQRGGDAGGASRLGVLAGAGGQALQAQPLGGLQLLTQQQVVPGLLHLDEGSPAQCRASPHPARGHPLGEGASPASLTQLLVSRGSDGAQHSPVPPSWDSGVALHGKCPVRLFPTLTSCSRLSFSSSH